MRIRLSPSLISLLFSNLAVIIMAVVSEWSLRETLWIYWLQSIIIGIFQAAKMGGLEMFSTAGVTVNGRTILPTKETKTKIVLFFLFHYGFFHFVYAIFLAQSFRIAAWQAVVFPVIIFFANHSLSFALNRQQDKAQKPNIGRMMLFPYARIVPMHLVLMLGSFLPNSIVTLVIFMLLKTFADVAMHVLEHRQLVNEPADVIV